MSYNRVARNKEMSRLRWVDGWTFDKIAIKFGVSRERVCQIVGRGRIKVKSSANPTTARALEVRGLVRDRTDMTTEEVSRELGVSLSAVRVAWGGLRHKLSGTNILHQRGFDAEEYVSAALTSSGIPNALTNSRPIDLILGDGRTVEIKSRHSPEPHRSSENWYFFPLTRSLAIERPPDFFILAVVNGKTDLFVIPREKVPQHGGVGFAWPEGTYTHRNHWQQYHNRFDLLCKTTS